jgi:hypothetical protein
MDMKKSVGLWVVAVTVCFGCSKSEEVNTPTVPIKNPTESPVAEKPKVADVNQPVVPKAGSTEPKAIAPPVLTENNSLPKEIEPPKSKGWVATPAVTTGVFAPMESAIRGLKNTKVKMEAVANYAVGGGTNDIDCVIADSKRYLLNYVILEKKSIWNFEQYTDRCHQRIF